MIRQCCLMRGFKFPSRDCQVHKHSIDAQLVHFIDEISFIHNMNDDSRNKQKLLLLEKVGDVDMGSSQTGKTACHVLPLIVTVLRGQTRTKTIDLYGVRRT